jgi:hypothetical protein
MSRDAVWTYRIGLRRRRGGRPDDAAGTGGSHRPPVYLDSFTVVRGLRLPCAAVTYRPVMAERYLPPDDLPPELLFFAMASSWVGTR